MANLEDVRRIALALPETSEKLSHGNLAWHVKDKHFVWERPLRKADLEALGDAAPTGVIIGVRVPDEGAKQALVAAEPDLYFTTPHFNGYPAVLVCLDEISVADLEELVIEAWLSRAPVRVARSYLEDST
jgi:hypothetical protein